MKNTISSNLKVHEGCESFETIELKSKNGGCWVGKGTRLKINTSIGIGNTRDIGTEIDKIKAISKFDIKPDIVMDLSIIPIKDRLYKIIQEEIGCAVGTVPIYTCFDPRIGFQKNRILEEIERLGEDGVSFVTLHLTADLSIYRKSLNRNIPVVSRGGSLLLRDMIKNNREQNILIECFEDICKIIKKNKMAISIGTTFRPSTLFDALDSTQLDEIEIQKSFIKKLHEMKIPTIMEGIGHIALKDIREYVELIREKNYVPIMPLGPIPTDRAAGWDHISAAIGASYMAMENGADIINTITREEHMGGIPTIDSIYEALKTAEVVVKVVSDSRFFHQYNKAMDYKPMNCMENNSFVKGCSRCGYECPFLLYDSKEGV